MTLKFYLSLLSSYLYLIDTYQHGAAWSSFHTTANIRFVTTVSCTSHCPLPIQIMVTLWLFPRNVALFILHDLWVDTLCGYCYAMVYFVCPGAVS